MSVLDDLVSTSRALGRSRTVATAASAARRANERVGGISARADRDRPGPRPGGVVAAADRLPLAQGAQGQYRDHGDPTGPDDRSQNVTSPTAAPPEPPRSAKA